MTTEGEHPNDDATTAPAISVKFTDVGRAYTFLLPPEFRLDAKPRAGEHVVVSTEHGPSPAVVTALPEALAERRAATAVPLSVIRRATSDDTVARLKKEHREREAHRYCQLKVRERGLPIKLTQVEQHADGSRLVFFFTADGRVDFRDLVRDLAARFQMRIEMRQIGVRDEAKMLGGYGACGRPLCCTTWLPTFEPVSIRMAKQQQLSLNPSRLSGVCGRLKCCLRFELPNAKGERYAGCAHEGSCSGSCAGGGSCGSGGCGGCAGKGSV